MLWTEMSYIQFDDDQSDQKIIYSNNNENGEC